MAALQLNNAELLVGPGQQAGRRGVEEGGNPKDRTGAICEGSETLPQDQQQVHGQHHLCVPLEQHPMCHLQ